MSPAIWPNSWPSGATGREPKISIALAWVSRSRRRGPMSRTAAAASRTAVEVWSTVGPKLAAVAAASSRTSAVRTMIASRLTASETIRSPSEPIRPLAEIRAAIPMAAASSPTTP